MSNKSVCLPDLEAEIEFARRAAKDFEEHPEHSSYGDLEPGSLLALRWGLGNDCVYVFKLDEYFVPTNYMNIVGKGSAS